MGKRKFKKSYWLYGALAIAAIGLAFTKVQGFAPGKVHADFAFEPTWEPPGMPAETAQILDQPFFYLGKGVQCYAFISQDGQAVLKVFKHYHTWPSSRLLRKLPAPGVFKAFKQAVLQAREKRVRQIYSSCITAFEKYKEETGLIAVHLNKTPVHCKQLVLYDKLGFAHRFDPSKIPFALQKKAQLVYPTLNHLMQSHNLDGAKQAISGLLDLIAKRCQKGIVNQDAMLVRNFGFIKGQPVEIDIGSFRSDPFIASPAALKKEVFYESKQLKHWLEKKYPELLPYFNEKIDTLLHSGP